MEHLQAGIDQILLSQERLRSSNTSHPNVPPLMLNTGSNVQILDTNTAGTGIISQTPNARLVDSPLENQRRLQAFMSVSQEEEVEWVGDGATGISAGPFSFRGGRVDGADERVITEHTENSDEAKQLKAYRSKLYESL